jgi:glyoxylate reductase
MRVLLTGPGYAPRHLSRLSAEGYDVLHREAVDLDELRSLLPSLDAYVLAGDERLDADALERAERLRVISFVGTGFGEFVDEEAARRRRIAVTNTPGVAAPAVAEHTIGLLLGLTRRLFAQNEAVKRGRPAGGATTEVGSTTVGIVGLGAVGTRVARILRTAFGSAVVYTSRTRKPELEEELGLRWGDLRTVFAEADAIVLLAPTSPETVGLVGEEALAAAGRRPVLVNTAGAALVDPEALARALDDGRVAAAAFDGYWIEPLPDPTEDPYGLLRRDDAQFYVTPHVAAKTGQSWERMVDRAVDNVLEAIAHGG